MEFVYGFVHRFMKPNVDFEGGVNGFDKLEVCRHEYSSESVYGFIRRFIKPKFVSARRRGGGIWMGMPICRGLKPMLGRGLMENRPHVTNKKPRSGTRPGGVGGGRYWTRTSDLHDVNVAL